MNIEVAAITGRLDKAVCSSDQGAPQGAREPTEQGEEGLTSFEVFSHIIEKNTAITQLHLVTFYDSPNWEAALRKPQEPSIDVRRHAMQQDRGRRRVFAIARDSVDATKIRHMAENMPRDQLLGVLSKVELADGTIAHIPMMDFICDVCCENLSILKELLRVAGQESGVILMSGRSYHFYGLELLSEKEWGIFLGKCLLMYRLVDSRYVGHQLIDGYCVLRLSSGGTKVQVPTVVARL